MKRTLLFALTLLAGSPAAARPTAEAALRPAGSVAVDAQPAVAALFTPVPADSLAVSGAGAPAGSAGSDSLAASAAELDRLFADAVEKLAAAGLVKPIGGAEADASARTAETGSSARAARALKRGGARTAAAGSVGAAVLARDTRTAAAAAREAQTSAALDGRTGSALDGQAASAREAKAVSAAPEPLAATSEVLVPTAGADTLAPLAPHERSRFRQFLPRFHRVDREIDRGRFVYRGEVILGMTASYGTLSSEDTDFLTILDNINLSGTLASVKPFFGYHYRDNRCVGIRLGYYYLKGDLGNVDLDLGEQNDISLNISNMLLKSTSYSFGLFHRSYVGIDPKGRLGLFSEVEASITSGTSDFINDSGETHKATYSDVLRLKLAFNPGLAIYIFPNVCATVSVGLGGLQYNSVIQHDADGNRTGSRRASKMRFRLNIADINFGLVIHLWDKKREQ